MALFCATFRRYSVFLLSFRFLSHIHVFSCEILLICRLKCPYSCSSFIFIFLLFCSFDAYSIVSGGGNQCSSALFYVVVLLFYRCIDVIFNAGKSFSFFSSHIQSVYVISAMLSLMHRHEFSCSLAHSFKFFPRPLQEWSRVSYVGDSSGILMRFLLCSLVSSSFLVLLRYSFL